MNVIACGLTSQERLQYSGRPYPACLPENDRRHHSRRNILQAHLCIAVASMRKQTVVEIVHEESFLHAEPVKPPPSLHLRLPAAVVELAVYVFREHHAGAVLLFSVPTLPFLAKFGTVVYRIPTLRRRETYGTFLIGQSAPFLIHPSPN